MWSLAKVRRILVKYIIILVYKVILFFLSIFFVKNVISLVEDESEIICIVLLNFFIGYVFGYANYSSVSFFGVDVKCYWIYLIICGDFSYCLNEFM